MSNYMSHRPPLLILAAAFQAMDVLGWLFTLGLAGSVCQGKRHAQRAYRAQDKLE
jgi:hypothetical protein